MRYHEYGADHWEVLGPCQSFAGESGPWPNEGVSGLQSPPRMGQLACLKQLHGEIMGWI